MQRRAFLQFTVLSAASVALGGCGGGDGDGDSPSADVVHGFPQSVASGDPKADSVILWTRVDGEGLIGVRVQVALDEGFTQLVLDDDTVRALPMHGHCVKVKVVNLEPYRHYYYRFIAGGMTSPVGRAKTAATLDMDVPARFAVLNCQDYIGRYYNSLAWLLAQENEPDFVLHVGDYIYETAGDPSFQSTDGERQITFADQAGAIQLGSPEAPYYAANSVSNYRDLYNTYRTDPMLQRLHERFSMVAIWDDHEFSDDCHGATATYHDGKQDENSPQRRLNAEQVYFEYMPVDDPRLGDYHEFFPAAEQLYPHGQLYRDLRFGRHFELLALDYRSFRPDHRIPEDAFPGAVVLDRETITAMLEQQYPGMGALLYEQQKSLLGPYVDFSQEPWSHYVPGLVLVLAQAYGAEGLDSTAASQRAVQALSGKVSAFVVRSLLTQYNGAVQLGLLQGDLLAPIDDDTYDNVLDRGLAYLHFGKQAFFSEFGSRYGVVKPSYDQYVQFLAAMELQQGQQPENVYGDAQQAWLDQKIMTSTATFLGLASSVSTASLILDLSEQTSLPASFQTQFYLNVDHWDGFPTRREILLKTLQARGNSFLCSGDIHAAFVSDHGGVADFTAPAVSSGTFHTFVADAIPGVAASFSAEQQQLLSAMFVQNLDLALQAAAGFDTLRFAETNRHGFVMVEVTGTQTTATYHLIEEAAVHRSYYDQLDVLAGMMEQKTFVLQNNTLQAG